MSACGPVNQVLLKECCGKEERNKFTMTHNDPTVLFFFSFFLSLSATSRYMEYPGQGSDPSRSHNLSCSCGNAGSLTTVLGWRLTRHPSAPKTLSIPLCHSRNSNPTVLKHATLCQRPLNFQLHLKLWEGSWNLAKQASKSASHTGFKKYNNTGRKHQARTFILFLSYCF